VPSALGAEGGVTVRRKTSTKLIFERRVEPRVEIVIRAEISTPRRLSRMKTGEAFNFSRSWPRSKLIHPV
jgi:hypothetical protein